MRFYSFVNGLYMNSLQYGLQTAHAVSEMSLENNHLYKEWAKNHKTIIILDALNLAGVERAFSLLATLIPLYNQYLPIGEGIPFVAFNEDIQSLGGIMTCAGVVLPEHIYDRKEEIFDPALTIMRPVVPSPRARLLEWEMNTEGYYDVTTIPKDKLEDLIYCLVKTHNLAPR